MSMEVELNGKAGRVCQHALDGTIRCPCIVRTTSEDVVVGNVFGMLKHIRPHLWLTPLLNAAYDTDRYRQVWYKNLSVRFWERQERFPPELLSFKEGRTEPDIIIGWDNPPTTLWIEAKWGSPVAQHTSGDRTNDQVVRGIRTLLHATGHISQTELIPVPRRRAMWLALVVDDDDEVLNTYPDRSVTIRLRDRSTHTFAFGVSRWGDVERSLNESHGTGVEQQILASTSRYLKEKLNLMPEALVPRPSQKRLPLPQVSA